MILEENPGAIVPGEYVVVARLWCNGTHPGHEVAVPLPVEAELTRVLGAFWLMSEGQDGAHLQGGLSLLGIYQGDGKVYDAALQEQVVTAVRLWSSAQELRVRLTARSGPLSQRRVRLGEMGAPPGTPFSKLLIAGYRQIEDWRGLDPEMLSLSVITTLDTPLGEHCIAHPQQQRMVERLTTLARHRCRS